MDSEKLQLVYDYAANPNINTEGIVVIKDGYIVGEAYFRNLTRDSHHDSWSVAKSFTSALIGIALDRGLIGSVDDEVYQFYPQWQTAETPEIKKRITVRHLLNMMGGLEWSEETYEQASDEDIYRMYREGVVDFVQYVLNKPITAEPGTRWYYSSGETLLLSGIIERVTGRTTFRFAQENLFAPLGISQIEWESDYAGNTITAWGIATTVRDYAKFGYLYLNEGEWDGQQVVSSAWVNESTRAISDELDHYGYQWWLPYGWASYRDAGVTANTFIAMGLYIQRVIVIPEHNLVAVRVGLDDESEDPEWSTAEFIRLIQDAIM
jgi:CubicO group peptidase (beta-lactamase class C family)